MRYPRPYLFSLLLFCILTNRSGAQCISNFPYVETFENSNGNWIPGGTNSDWAWGATSKFGAPPNGAAWMTGGLVNHFYNDNEDSWLMSPCFDFTNVTHPRVNFHGIWDTEKNADGASFQYSTDGGSTWITLGTPNESPCSALNWYNNPSVTYLGTPGWSGNNQPTTGSCSGGSGCQSGGVQFVYFLTMLAGQPSVFFRFRFASGPGCNNYDGFFISNIIVNDQAAPSGGEDFYYSCSAGNSISFTSTFLGCPSGYLWDFDDPASGTSNSSVSRNPTHIFSGPGLYNVTEKFFYTNAPTVTISHQVPVFTVKIDTLSLVNCAADHTGSLTALANGPAGFVMDYLWYTTPQQFTQTISGLNAGTYTVKVSVAGSCSYNATASLTEPTPITADISFTDADCSSASGTAIVNPSGGSPPYNYLWSNGAATASVSGLVPGTYAVDIRDMNNCKISKTGIVIKKINKPVPVFLGNDTTICAGQTLTLSPGIYTNYLWQDNSAGPVYVVRTSGKYNVLVTDNSGCTGSDTINVVADCSDIQFPNAFTPDHNSLNDRFGPLGNTSNVKNYSLKVYGRWSELIFSSTNPSESWDGTFKGKSYNSGSFLWIASYSINNGPIKKKYGLVTVIK